MDQHEQGKSPHVDHLEYDGHPKAERQPMMKAISTEVMEETVQEKSELSNLKVRKSLYNRTSSVGLKPRQHKSLLKRAHQESKKDLTVKVCSWAQII